MSASLNRGGWDIFGCVSAWPRYNVVEVLEADMSDQAKRVRSPNYPAIGLADAVGRLERLFERMNRHAAPKEAVVRALGYGGWNGASAAVASAFLKFGLLERVGEDAFKITPRAMNVLYGTAEEKAAALKAAALAPSLYEELFQAFPGTVPHDDILRPWLIKRNFGPAAVAGVIAGYRETLDVARLAVQNDGNQSAPPSVTQTSSPLSDNVDTQATPTMSPAPQQNAAHQEVANIVQYREERIMDDDGNNIVLRFPSDPTLETYSFLKEYLEFRILRLLRITNNKLEQDI